jgi:hypothetical protein
MLGDTGGGFLLGELKVGPRLPVVFALLLQLLQVGPEPLRLQHEVDHGRLPDPGGDRGRPT